MLAKWLVLKQQPYNWCASFQQSRKIVRNVRSILRRIHIEAIQAAHQHHQANNPISYQLIASKSHDFHLKFHFQRWNRYMHRAHHCFKS